MPAVFLPSPAFAGWPFWADNIYTTGDIQLAINLAASTEYTLRAQTRY